MWVGGWGLNCVRGVQVCVGRGGSSLSVYPSFMDVMYICMHVC